MTATTTAGQAGVVTGAPVLEVADLSVDFGVDSVWVPAAKKLRYSIQAGEVLAIVGESGSGKSASSMAILDLLPKNSRVRGSIKLEGRELTGLSPQQMRRVRGRQVSVIFQEPMTALNPVYTVGFQIVETLRIHFGMSPHEAKERALALLGMVELPDPVKVFNSYPHQLSGGQRQRAMIAQSISCDPKLLIADEPTTALDVTVQAEILELLRSLRDRLDSAILLITHDMGVVADLADNIVVMRKGDIVESGTVAEVFAAPKHPYTVALLEAVPHLGQREDEEIDTTAALAAGTANRDAEFAERIRVNERLAAAEHEKAELDKRRIVVEFDKVSIEYPKRGRFPAFRAATDIDLTIHEGEVVGLVGESGSGKTTLGRAAIALLPIHSGRLVIAGQDISDANRDEIRKLHRNVGIVFQDPSSSLNPRLQIADSIGEPLRLAKGLKGMELAKEVDRLLDSVELLRAYRSRFPHELSGGQKQRVGIARALSLKPQVLIADEPTSALDVSVQARVLELMQQLQKEMNFACLFITHDLAVIDVLADRIAVMHHGSLVEVGTRDEILRYPKEAYTQRLLAAVPLPDPEQQRARRALRLELLAAGSDEVVPVNEGLPPEPEPPVAQGL
ncbi:oligopeptide transporter [Leifsonia xyli subsp. cynodontis DSM 46306]|uniref:ABC transporter domain-containing protein n=1 Tax=Leifsonia xyli subsp. cynodontis DSM 46306 TaxID=1389489 RepID=U3P6H0_LEIXC|nr:ABC transporter ATP-binding protein [Leifsonia xyli]AGW41910.1 oligopeptide transporter [Leifsonia xyli subsp. cynodontis DSM 46306]